MTGREVTMEYEGVIGFNFQWKVALNENGYPRLDRVENGEKRSTELIYLDKYGDDPLLHRFLLPDGASDDAVTATITAMREAVIAVSKKWYRRTPWPDAPKPQLPDGLAPFPVYWGAVGAALVPDTTARLEAAGVVRRVMNAEESRPAGHPNPYVLELDWTHRCDEAGRLLAIFAEYAGEEARAQLCAWMDWGPQWEGWVEEGERHNKPPPGAPSVFDVDW